MNVIGLLVKTSFVIPIGAKEVSPAVKSPSINPLGIKFPNWFVISPPVHEIDCQ